MPELLARSSNVGFAQVFDRLGGARFDRGLQRFRFAPPPELAAAPAGDWNASLVAIGATMSATPRQVALACAALADGGGGIAKVSTAARVSALRAERTPRTIARGVQSGIDGRACGPAGLASGRDRHYIGRPWLTPLASWSLLLPQTCSAVR